MKRFARVLVVPVFLIALLAILLGAFTFLATQATVDLKRWALIGGSLSGISAAFSGLALVGLVINALMQSRQIAAQTKMMAMTSEQIRRSSEFSTRQLHVDLIKMALDDPELAAVWPPIGNGLIETRRDHYSNLILYLQQIAFESKTIDEPELVSVLDYLMQSPDIYDFWRKARSTHELITSLDMSEKTFSNYVDRAFNRATMRAGDTTRNWVHALRQAIVRALGS